VLSNQISQKALNLEVSSKSADSIVDIRHPARRILVVNTLPLIVVVLLVVDGAMNDRLPYVEEEEKRNRRENKSYPVS
jgi:hypothetical protein